MLPFIIFNTHTHTHTHMHTHISFKLEILPIHHQNLKNTLKNMTVFQLEPLENCDDERVKGKTETNTPYNIT